MSDAHRYDVGGFAGDQVIRTPNLDKLTNNAVVFNNAYTPAPICIPARQSIMAGQYPSTTGCRQYGEDLSAGHRTLARELALHGYTTVACGKLHHKGTDQLQGWIRRIGGDVELGHRYLPDAVRQCYQSAKPREAVGGSSKMLAEIRRAGVGRSRYAVHDEYTIVGATNFIEQFFVEENHGSGSAPPLALKVSLHQPHYPYLTEAELLEYYSDRVEPYLCEQASAHPVLSRRQVRPAIDVREQRLRDATAAYYGMVETVDRQFGKVVDALHAVGQDLERWIVVYTADHGEMLGQHRVWEKRKFYEGSVRVPLIIGAPGRSGQAHSRVSKNVSTCDLFPTICDLAGVPIPDGLDGRSLRALIEGADVEWNNEVMSQYGAEHLMIKLDALKYQWYGRLLPEVLFDLDRDPKENTDFARDPRYADVLREFRMRRDELGYGDDLPGAR